jgi:hypothetical protein
LFITGRLDRSKRHPLSLTFPLLRQELTAQHVLLFSALSYEVPRANIAKTRG